jgi:hypothetical protein
MNVKILITHALPCICMCLRTRRSYVGIYIFIYVYLFIYLYSLLVSNVVNSYVLRSTHRP